MEQNRGGEEGNLTPEHREGLVIHSVVIPASDEEPVRRHELAVGSLSDYQALVGGLVQAIDLEQPSMRLYCNEEGKLHELPINRRATALLWGHNAAFRYRDVIAGDAFLVGPMGRRGLDTNVPDELVAMLFEARSFRVNIRVRGQEEWQREEARPGSWLEAYGYALTLMHGWLEAEGFAVVPEADGPTP